MQALSLTVHIPIVCFGIAFPAMMLFVEGLYLRTGDATYKALAKRWSKVAVTLFAVGVVTGTILSFEFGLLWPEFMARFGEVFGIGFALEGISFFVEAIFIAIYVYGWDRLSRRAHFLTGIPVVLSGFAGSFNVIAVNGWMNDPTGFDLGPNGEVLNPRPWAALLNSNMWHELIHMYLAGYLVCGFIVAGVYAYAWLRGRRDHYHRTALVVTLAFASLCAPVQVIVGDWAGREVAERQPVKLAAMEGLQHTHARARRSRSAASTTRRAARCASASRSRGCSRCWPSTTRTRRSSGSTRSRPRTARRSTSCASRSRRWPGSAPGWRCSASVPRDLVPQAAAAAVAVVLPRGDGGRAAVVRRADRGLDHDRGRPPAVDRLRGHAHRGGGHRGRRARGRLRRADRRLRRRWASRSSWLLRRLARKPPETEVARCWLRSAPAFIVLGIAAYAVLGSADFGAGFWDLTAGGAVAAGALRGMIQRSMAPVWEANHVWLIFVLVIVWTAFPTAFGSIFSTLYIPLFLAAIGIIFRGTAFALRGQAATIREARVLGALFATASVLIPFCFGAVLGGIASGRVGLGNATGDPIDSWLNPTSALIGVIAVLTGAYLAAVYLAGDSVRAEQPDLARGVPRAGAAGGRGERRRRDRRAVRPALRRAGALRRPDLRRRAGDGPRLRRWRARRRWRSSGPSATAWRA